MMIIYRLLVLSVIYSLYQIMRRFGFSKIYHLKTSALKKSFKGISIILQNRCMVYMVIPRSLLVLSQRFSSCLSISCLFANSIWLKPDFNLSSAMRFAIACFRMWSSFVSFAMLQFCYIYKKHSNPFGLQEVIPIFVGNTHICDSSNKILKLSL